MTRFLFYVLIIVMLAGCSEVREDLGGYVSEIDNEAGHPVLYLDISPEYDRNNDTNTLNDKDIWVSTEDEDIALRLLGINLGEYVYGFVRWDEKETEANLINHYYFLKLYQINSQGS